MALSSSNQVFTISSSSNDSNCEVFGGIKNRGEINETCEYSRGNSSVTRQRQPLHVISDSEESDISLPPRKSRSRSKSISPIPSISLYSSRLSANNAIGLEQKYFLPSDSVEDATSKKLKSSSELLPTIEKKKKTVVNRARNGDKAERALQRLKERETKQQEKALAKALKDFEKETKRTEKPEECIKLMKLSIDDKLTEIVDISHTFNILLDAGISYSLKKNHIPSSIIWYRHLSEAVILENQLQRNEREELENVMFLCIPSLLFVDLIFASLQKRKGLAVTDISLLEYLTNIKMSFPKMDLTIVTVGLQNILKGKKGNLKRDNEGNQIIQPKGKNVSKKDVDEVLIELQLQMFLNYQSVDNSTELGNLLIKYTKAIAESPLKKEKYQQQGQFSWYAQADSSRPIKISKNGVGFTDLWQQQIQQFNLITKDIAQAIVAKYSSPSLLIQAYKKCSSVKEAEKLLEDIIVRRDYGPLGTTRRVGPQLSYKMYRFFTSTNGDELLQR